MGAMAIESESLEGEPRTDPQAAPQIDPQIDQVAVGPLDLEIEGMTCAGCVARVERALASVSVVTNSLLLRRLELNKAGGDS